LASRLGRTINVFFMMLGIGLLVWLLLHLDAEEIADRLIQVGWYFPFAFLAYTFANMITTYSWKEIVDPSQSKARYRDFLAAFWAGHAVNALTPGGSLGEVFRGNIMRGKVNGEEIVASLMILYFMNTLAVNLFTLVGPLACLLLADLPVDVVLILFGIAVLFFVPVILMFIMLRLGAAHKLVWLLSRIPFVKLKDPDGLMDKARSIDQKVRNFRKARPRAFARALVCLFSVRLFQVAEVWIVLMALVSGQESGQLLLLAFLTQTASQLIAWGLAFVPGQMGVAEGGSALLFKWLGMDPLTGLSMELVRRIRKVIGISIGLLLGVLVGLRKR